MPELPDITLYVEALRTRIVGQPLTRVDLKSAFVLRSVTPAIGELAGRRVRDVRRLGKRIVLAFDAELFLVMHLMIAGRLRWRAPGEKLGFGGKMLLASVVFPNGTLFLTEASSKKRASIELLRGQAALDSQNRGGVEPLEASLEQFAAAITSENHTLKRALTDPRLVSGIGNAYSDEILHAARLSPMKLTQSMGGDEIARLYDATRATLLVWIDHLRGELKGGFPEKVRWPCTAASSSHVLSAALPFNGSSTQKTSATTARGVRPAAGGWPIDRFHGCSKATGRAACCKRL